VREEVLQDIFEDHQLRCHKILIIRNEKGQSKGNGIIEFESTKDADYAVKKLSGMDIEKRKVYFDYAKNNVGGGGGGNGGGGS
jgi:RNA recognition motif-containing protein